MRGWYLSKVCGSFKGYSIMYLGFFSIVVRLFGVLVGSGGGGSFVFLCGVV